MHPHPRFSLGLGSESGRLPIDADPYGFLNFPLMASPTLQQKRRSSSGPSPDAFEKLTEAISALDNKVTQLTLRLTGDANLQTRGLIDDVHQIRTNVNTLLEHDSSHGTKIAALEKQNVDQAGLLEDLKFVRLCTDKFWKIATLFILGGVLNPVFAGAVKAIFGWK